MIDDISMSEKRRRLCILIANIIDQRFSWRDLTVDICISLATFSPPTHAFKFGIAAQKLAERARRIKPELLALPKHWDPSWGSASSDPLSDFDTRVYLSGLMSRTVL